MYKPATSTYSVEQEAEAFKEIELQEKKVFLCALSFEKTRKNLFNTLEQSVKEEDTEKYEKISTYFLECQNFDFKVSSLDALHLHLRLCDPLKVWIFNNCENIKNIEDLYKQYQDFIEFRDWKKSLISEWEKLIKLKNNFSKLHLGLVFIESTKFSRTRKLTNFSTEDLFQEGFLGLMRAIDKFDYTKGFKFSTYSIHWIKFYLQRSVVDKDYHVRLPNSIHHKLHKIKLAKKRFSLENGRMPTIWELAKYSEQDEETVQIFEGSNGIISYEKILESSNRKKLFSLLEDKKAYGNFLELEQKELSNIVQKALKKLNPQEQFVIERRFGLDGNAETNTLQEIAQKYSVCRERIRQIEVQALEKLGSNIPKEEVF